MTRSVSGCEASHRGPRNARVRAAGRSAKESALKVLRTGLRADTRTVEVVLADPSGISTGAGQWQRLSVASGAGRLPGWWRRDGVFLLTVVAATGLAEPPRVLPGSADLSQAEPIHSWVNQPLVE